LSKFTCPICLKTYEWVGNVSGLLLMDAADFAMVCKGCESEGEELNKQFLMSERGIEIRVRDAKRVLAYLIDFYKRRAKELCDG